MDASEIVKRSAVYSAACELCYRVFEVSILRRCQSNEHIEMIISAPCLLISKASLCHTSSEGKKNMFRYIKGTLRDKLGFLFFFCSAESVSHILVEEYDYVFATLLA